GLMEMIQIPGLGPRRARLLHDRLGIDSIDRLEEACRQGSLARLTGVGAAAPEKILQGVLFLKRQLGSLLLSEAAKVGGELLETLRALPGVARAEAAGSLRRRKEVVRDIDLLVARRKGTPAADLIARFKSLPEVERILGAGDTKASVLIGSG